MESQCSLVEAELRHVCPVQVKIKRTSNCFRPLLHYLKFRLTRLIGRQHRAHFDVIKSLFFYDFS